MNALFRFATAALIGIAALIGTAQAQDRPIAAGTDYVVIEDGRPFGHDKNKIEVAEVFGYWCHHCANFEPLVEAWQRRLPGDVQFTYVPATFNANDPFARAYFAAKQLRLPATSHSALFRAIHADRNFPGNASDSELATFFSAYGVDSKRFLATMNSPAVAAQMRWARKFIEIAGVQGTPMLIVDGKYRVLGRSHEDAIRIADQLIAQIRAERR